MIKEFVNRNMLCFLEVKWLFFKIKEKKREEWRNSFLLGIELFDKIIIGEELSRI